MFLPSRASAHRILPAAACEVPDVKTRKARYGAAMVHRWRKLRI